MTYNRRDNGDEMKIKQRVYVDVTQLIHWQGPVAGIPRVMYEISRRFKSDNTSTIVHVSWVKEIKKFCEVDFAATMAKRGQGIVYIYSSEHNVVSANGDSQTSRSMYARKTLKVFKRFAKKVITKVGLEDMAIVRNTQDNLAYKEAQTYKSVNLERGDTIFISWGEWWDNNFLTTLEDGIKEKGVKVVPIIHDVLPFTSTPHFSGHSTKSLQDFCVRVVSISSMVLCVSKATRDDLSAWYTKQGIAIPPMYVFRLGENFEFAKAERPTEDAFKNSDLKGSDYIITVGTFEAKKNHTLLYYVYKLAAYRGIELPKLVIVGRRGWKTDHIYDFMTQDPQVNDKFVFLHDASDENLSWLYDHALLSVFPSFAEGWGMPIAESIARGIPCACSNTTSMTEIAEGYVRHFSPASTDECLSVIHDMLNPETLVGLRMKCKEYKETSWDESYKQIRDYMKEVINV